jgi:short-subunit dehydrogenase
MAFPAADRQPVIRDWHNRVVFITGASMGIGAACARAFARRGARLILTARSAGALEEISRAAPPGQARVLPADLSRPEQVGELAEHALGCWGRIDVLVNNAGVGVYLPCWKLEPEQARAMMEVNFFAPLELMRRLIPAMRQQGGGTIANVSSIAGQVALPWLTLYSASKAALNFLSEGLRMELRGSGVQVVAVCPGYVKTGFPEHVLAGQIPAPVARRRHFTITAEECAEAIVRGVERGRRTVVTPRLGWAFVWFARLFPRTADGVLAGLRGPNPE